MTDLLRVEGVHASCKNQVLLAGVDFRLPRGLLGVVAGAPHSGKTTLLKVLLGLQSHQGQVVWQSPEMQVAALQRVWRLGLRAPWIWPWTSCMEFLLHLPHYRSLLDPQAWARTALLQVGLHAVAHTPVGQLSRSMRVKLWMASQVVPQNPLVLLDEPMVSLSPQDRKEVWLVLRRLVWEGHTVLVTTPCLQEAEQYGEYLVMLHQGQVVAEGEFAQLTSQRRVHLQVDDLSRTLEVLRQLGIQGKPDEGQTGIWVDAPMEEVQRWIPMLHQQAIEVQECHPEGLLSLYCRLQHPS